MDSVAVIADAKSTLLDLTGTLSEMNYNSGWTEEILSARNNYIAEMDYNYSMELPEGISQTRVLGEINKFVTPDAIVVGSSGSLPGCMQRLWRSIAPKTYHMEYGFSCMGYEICGAVGVKLAEPGHEVYVMVGDGSFLMLHSELYTAIQEGVKINIMLFDNSGWGCIENLQNNQGTKTFGTRFFARNPSTGLLDGEIVQIDFAKIAEGYGCKAYRVESIEQLHDALEDSKAQSCCTLFDIKVVHGSMSHGYDAWWRVGVAEVSESETVQAAYKDMKCNIEKARQY
jgi:3D-(3,5/4)-trihydroxycyclohexane-1,2-dione acylhydrolase (decyclizing)